MPSCLECKHCTTIHFTQVLSLHALSYRFGYYCTQWGSQALRSDIPNILILSLVCHRFEQGEGKRLTKKGPKDTNCSNCINQNSCNGLVPNCLRFHKGLSQVRSYRCSTCSERHTTKGPLGNEEFCPECLITIQNFKLREKSESKKKVKLEARPKPKVGQRKIQIKED